MAADSSGPCLLPPLLLHLVIVLEHPHQHLKVLHKCATTTYPHLLASPHLHKVFYAHLQKSGALIGGGRAMFHPYDWVTVREKDLFTERVTHSQRITEGGTVFSLQAELPIEDEVDVAGCSKAFLVGGESWHELKEERTLDQETEGAGRNHVEDRVIQTDPTHDQVELWVSSLDEVLQVLTVNPHLTIHDGLVVRELKVCGLVEDVLVAPLAIVLLILLSLTSIPNILLLLRSRLIGLPLHHGSESGLSPSEVSSRELTLLLKWW
jgi:hypothetical protein